MTASADLITPHGGSLINAWVPADDAAAAQAEANALPRICLDSDALLDLQRLADGTFSPLSGFVGSADLRSICEHLTLANGVLWPLPVLLPADRSTAANLREGQRYALVASTDSPPLATIEVEERFEASTEIMTAALYGTSNDEHPGVARALARGRTYVAGPIQLFAAPPARDAAQWIATPRQTREAIRTAGFQSCTGFQTRNLGHRAHEHLQKIALQYTDGLLIHPLVGWKKSGDMLPEVVMEGYELLRQLYFPKHRTLLFALSTAMRYAGPREAVFHALIRKNHGCTHFIVGRDHAGVGDWYATYAAHELIRSLDQADLGIQPLLLRGPRWCRQCGEIATDAACPHGDAAVLSISGTEVRAMVGRGERPPPEIMRPEIADFLIARQREGRAFHEPDRS